MRCAACEDPDGGFAHTCAGSGTYVAAEAHVAGAVDEITADWSRYDVAVHFQIRSLDEQMVNEKLTPLVAALLSDDLIERSHFTVTLAEQDAA